MTAAALAFVLVLAVVAVGSAWWLGRDRGRP